MFGLLADTFGRKAIYGKELMVIIAATIFQMSAPSHWDGHRVLIWITISRVFLGIGIGGDYPMSATVVSDRANIHRRGTLLTFIFANQGWGSFVGSLITIITLEGFKGRLKSGHTHDVDKIWRVLIGLSLIPAFGTLYQRLTLPESRKFELTKTREVAAETGTATTELPATTTEKKQELNANAQVTEANSEQSSIKVPPSPSSEVNVNGHSEVADKQAHWREFVEFFSTWNHFRLLLGSMLSWFLVDIAFYGINVRLLLIVMR